MSQAISKTLPAPAASTPQARKNIIRKAVEKVKAPLNDYEKSLKLIDKHKLPVTYGALGTDVTHGAASHHDESINIKDAYTPRTVIVRGLQRAAMGAAAGAAGSMLTDEKGILGNVGKGAAIGALVGVTAGPALMYGAGKLAEHIRLKSKNSKNKGK